MKAIFLAVLVTASTDSSHLEAMAMVIQLDKSIVAKAALEAALALWKTASVDLMLPLRNLLSAPAKVIAAAMGAVASTAIISALTAK